MTNKYANGKIYMIESDQWKKCYIGSSTQKLSKRMVNHRDDYKRYQEGKRNYLTSFEILKYDDAKIYLVEDFPCSSREHLEARERHWIKESDCVNKIQPTRTKQEYREENRDIIRQKDRERYESEKDKIQKRQKTYREANKDKLKTYRESNKEAIKLKSSEWSSQRVQCECSAKVSRCNLRRHKISKLHASNMAKLNTTN